MPAQAGMSLECEVPVLSGAELVETEGGHHYATWYRNRHYSSELAGKSVDKSSPSDNCFYGGKNIVVYNETLQSIDVLSLALSPLGLDWIADGFGAIYAGYYGDELNATLYGTAVFLPIISYSAIKITGKNLLKGLLTGNSELVKDGSGFVLREVLQGAGNWMDDIFDIQKSVFNQNKNIIANMTSNHKGAWGEIATDAYLTEKGFQPLHHRKTALTDGWGETGIDGIFKKDGQYYIIEAKYTGFSTLNTTIDGKQLSNGWIEGSSRLENAVGRDLANDIKQMGYKKIWAKVAPDGSISFKEATDNFATTFIDFTP